MEREKNKQINYNLTLNPLWTRNLIFFIKSPPLFAFFTLPLCTCHTRLVVQRAPHPNNCTPMVWNYVVHYLLLMVALHIPMAHSVKSKSIKRPYVRGVQTLAVFLCFGSSCPGTTAPLCHNSTPKLIRCSTLYPGIKGIEDSFCCKGVPKSMASFSC